MFSLISPKNYSDSAAGRSCPREATYVFSYTSTPVELRPIKQDDVQQLSKRINEMRLDLFNITVIISLIPNIKQQQKQKQISNSDNDIKNSNRNKDNINNSTNSDNNNKKLQQKVLFFKRGWQRQVILAIMENLVLDGPELHWYYFSDSCDCRDNGAGHASYLWKNTID